MKNFDEELRIKKGDYQYRLDKSKAGRCSSTAGRPRPYAAKNMAVARLYSPNTIGHTLTVAAKRSFGRFRTGAYYQARVEEDGVIVAGEFFDREELRELFIIK